MDPASGRSRAGRALPLSRKISRMPPNSGSVSSLAHDFEALVWELESRLCRRPQHYARRVRCATGLGPDTPRSVRTTQIGSRV